jgi:hypothetical protein
MECNNVACDFLTLNDAGSAMEIFSVALKLMRMISQIRVDPHFHVDLAKKAIQARGRARQLLAMVQKLQQRSNDDNNDHQRSTSSSTNKFVAGATKMNFVLCSRPSSLATIVAIDLSFLNKNSTILLYNMGMACLVHGTPPMLSKSLSFFEMAYQLGIGTVTAGTNGCNGTITNRHFFNDHNNYGCHDDRVLQRICMDSLHLSAQLYHSNSDFDMAERILIELRELIGQLPPTQDPQEQRRRRLFWILVDLLPKPTLAPAA